ncbi:MAG: crosslink repair DNA glycosylase YcaQ family protein [Propionicimonas sp.]|uniref:winged helix-turn-helix domain-containing protein n=1 Tax=Propionicimonas sp. TaxID=1955623 RepID=UPI003D14EEFC
MTAELTAGQARRIMLTAQGLGRRPQGEPGTRHLQGVVNRLGQLQIDSVNVCVRAHYMPLFTRLGPYDRALLDRAGNSAPRRVYEFWGHAACLLDVGLQPVLRWRADAHRDRPWQAMSRILDEQPHLLDKVRGQIAERGPLTARQVEHDEQRTPGSWWNWSSVKSALEWLFYTGELTSAGRNSQFERRYDLPERVLPKAVLATPTPPEDEARLALARRAAAALGVFTPAWLAEYFYNDRSQTAVVLERMVASGEVEQVGVRGWSAPAYLWAEAARPRRVHVDALVAPFDPLVFDRKRLLEVFGTHYRIGLYTPKADRVHGYYVYPFVMDERVAARVDLKADRRAGALLVQSAWREEGAPEAETAARLGAELRRMADWLGLADVVVEDRGDLATALRAASGSSVLAGEVIS